MARAMLDRPPALPESQSSNSIFEALVVLVEIVNEREKGRDEGRGGPVEKGCNESVVPSDDDEVLI